MTDPVKYSKVTGHNLPNPLYNNHVTINYVDDSTNLITFNDLDQVKEYVELFYLFVHTVYSSNLLKINADKTKIMCFVYNNQTIDTSNFCCKCYDYTIRPKSCITILGYRISSNLSNDNQVSYLSQQCFNKINIIKSITNVTDQKTRLQLANAVIMGKLNYSLPLLSNISVTACNKVHKIIMTSARTFIGNYCYKSSCDKILKECDWFDVDSLVKFSSMKLIHSYLISKQANNIF